MDENQKLEQAPGQILLRLLFEEHRNLLPEVRQHPLCNFQTLRLELEEVGEVIDDDIRRDQVPPGLVQKRRDAARFVAEELGQHKIHDATGLRETVTHFFKQVQRHRVERINLAEV